MSSDFISLITILGLSFVFHYFEKICNRDYNKAKEDFDISVKTNSEWDYNFKKYKMDMDYTRKWAAFLFKWICLIASILGLISLIVKSL